MDVGAIFSSFQEVIGMELPRILAAVAVLIVGWILAIVIRAVARKTLGALKLNQRITKEDQSKPEVDLELGISTGLFWLVILVTVIAILDVLRMQLVSTPLNALATQIFDYMPKLLGGTLLILAAWLVASGIRFLVQKTLTSTSIDDKLSSEAGISSVSEKLANALYWFVILLFLPAILNAFQLEGLLSPVQRMLDKVLAFIPNIFAGAVLGIVGWYVAKVLRDLVTNLLMATGADRLGQKAGLHEDFSVSRLAGILVFIFIFIPALIAALNALEIGAISEPATEMLGVILNAIPNLFAAVIIIFVTYYVAKLVAGLVVNLLDSMQFNTLPEKIGLSGVFDSSLTPATLVGRIIVFFAMLFATVEAANSLGFNQVSEIVSMFIEFGGQIVIGAVILVVGFWLANLIHQGIMRVSGEDSRALAGLARVAILALVIAMGLRSMGIANDIVNLAFGLTLGAVAIAVALSFGLGGREAAGKQMEYWLSKLRKE
ncbi:MAG: mechanosensitive ion channel [Desulfurivibrio sp.]|nr:mechanosensitive ion channel [Desulfurivibrio sp.]